MFLRILAPNVGVDLCIVACVTCAYLRTLRRCPVCYVPPRVLQRQADGGTGERVDGQTSDRVDGRSRAPVR